MRFRFEPAIFASALLDKRDWRWHLTSAFSQRLRKYTFTAVHTKTHRRRFQIYSLWRVFSNLCVYGERFHRLRVDGRPKRIKKFAFTSVCVYNRLRAFSELQILARNCYWFIALFAPVVIGRSICFWFWFFDSHLKTALWVEN